MSGNTGTDQKIKMRNLFEEIINNVMKYRFPDTLDCCISVEEYKQIDDANDALVLQCRVRSGVLDPHEMHRKDKLNRATMRKENSKPLDVVASSFVYAQKNSLTINDALELSVKIIDWLGIQYAPKERTIKNWLKRANEIEGINTPKLNNVAKKAGKKLGTKNSYRSFIRTKKQ